MSRLGEAICWRIVVVTNDVLSSGEYVQVPIIRGNEQVVQGNFVWTTCHASCSSMCMSSSHLCMFFHVRDIEVPPFLRDDK
jgi:hypothetical protein